MKKETEYNIRITIGNNETEPDMDVYRDFRGTYDELHNRDWNERVRGFLDDVKGYLETL